MSGDGSGYEMTMPLMDRWKRHLASKAALTGRHDVWRHGCDSCDAGVITPGHCVDIDGDLWHGCVATDALEIADPGRRGRAGSSTPTGDKT